MGAIQHSIEQLALIQQALTESYVRELETHSQVDLQTKQRALAVMLECSFSILQLSSFVEL
jgi:type IV secretory pathway component VirB8